MIEYIFNNYTRFTKSKMMIFELTDETAHKPRKSVNFILYLLCDERVMES